MIARPALLAAVVLLAAPAVARAERVRVRHDTIVRLVPRYELRLDADADGTASRYWHRIEQAPIYQRISLDAEGIRLGGEEPCARAAGDSVAAGAPCRAPDRGDVPSLDLHLQAWGAADAAFPSDDQLLSGDFATAYARARLLPPLAIWGGRRFVTWGVPGGLHIDGIGIEQRSEFGLHLEALAGRPVSVVSTPLGPHSEFERPTGAYGARLGYSRPGEIAAAVSFLERWAEGIAADRVVMGSASARPDPRLDLLATASLDVRSGLSEARAQASWLASDAFEPDLSYVHADPQKLLPSWSILSMFATEVYDEVALGASGRLSPAISARLELGVRRGYVPGRHGTVDFGHRVQALLRIRPAPYDRELAVELGRRDEGDTSLVVARCGASFPLTRALRVAPVIGAAVDENDGARTALLLRALAELPVGDGWETSLSLDFARTPIARSELRGLVRVGYRFDAEGR